MHRLNELAEKLTPSQVKEVEDFAEFLLSRQQSLNDSRAAKYLNVEQVAGLCEGMGGDRTSVELVHEAVEGWGAKLDREHH
jgi:hypothetical protein